MSAPLGEEAEPGGGRKSDSASDAPGSREEQQEAQETVYYSPDEEGSRRADTPGSDALLSAELSPEVGV